jgi:hypothetical protein
MTNSLRSYFLCGSLDVGMFSPLIFPLHKFRHVFRDD